MGPDSGITIRILAAELIRTMDGLIGTVDDRLTDDKINSPTELMKIDRILGFTITKMDLGKKMAIFLARHKPRTGRFTKYFFPPT